MITKVSDGEALQLLAEHIGVSVDDLKKASEDKRESARIARLSAQIEAQKAAEAAALEKARKQFYDAWGAGHVLLRCDGKIITKVGTLCKDGEPNMAPVIRRVMDSRKKLLTEFKGLTGTDASITRGATVTKMISCTCGKQHEVMIFITSNK